MTAYFDCKHGDYFHPWRPPGNSSRHTGTSRRASTSSLYSAIAKGTAAQHGLWTLADDGDVAEHTASDLIDELSDDGASSVEDIGRKLEITERRGPKLRWYLEQRQPPRHLLEGRRQIG